MRSILTELSVAPEEADETIGIAIKAAADRQLQEIRGAIHRSETKHAADQLKSLVLGLKGLADAVAMLPPLEIQQINGAAAEDLKEFFDSDTFEEIVAVVYHELTAIVQEHSTADGLHAFYARVANTACTPADTLIDFWQLMPDVTRAQVESQVRHLKRKTGIIGFLRQLIMLVDEYGYGGKVGGPHSPARRFVLTVGTRWSELGLGEEIGRAYSPIERREMPSRFQQFCNFALTAVGSSLTISAQDVRNLKADLANRGKLSR